MALFLASHWFLVPRYEDLLLILLCMAIYDAYWVGVVFSYKCGVADNWQLHFCCMCVLATLTAAEWYNVSLYWVEVLNNLVTNDVSFFLWSDSLMGDFYTCVSRTHSGARCFLIHKYHCSQAIPAFATKACALASKWHLLKISEGMRYAVTATYGNWERKIQKKFRTFEKKESKTKEQFYNNDFRKVIFSNAIPYALHDLPTSKCKRHHNRPYQQNGIKFAQVNNSDLLRALKNLTKTRLNL